MYLAFMRIKYIFVLKNLKKMVKKLIFFNFFYKNQFYYIFIVKII